ncbi:hypothetical protein H3T59_08125 [Commensalibacter sp. M0357]|uniref:hypothetical protein n=1 Tax=unclassified Commensalibacter TaxID=2630218 RepID=UPI0018DE4DBB|nr:MULTISPECIES: hypothetical protein [unclassified Commensalibacter]MBI0075586.1 hypothetical protein [Commensalibacter sp. M0357]MBI0085427.1 hypothetical protein [Commensalibacter sp. M0355]
MSIQRPGKLFSSKWAEYGDRFNIEDTGADYQNGRADIETGFPPQTMKSVLQGGVPPWGQDHNGILYKITEAIQWTQGGGLAFFNQEWSNKVGGYALGSVLRSQRFIYVFYINMMDGNLIDPDTGKITSDYWVNYDKPGNNWAVLSILSDNSDNISFLDSDTFRITTKVAGPLANVYVRPSTKEVKFLGTPDFPFRTVQDAINAVPNGGTATIYLWYQDEYTLMQDNTMNLPGLLANGWDIGHRNLNFVPWGQDERDEFGNYNDETGALIDQLKHDLVSSHSEEGIWHFSIMKKPIIHIPVGVDNVSNMTIHGYIRGDLGASVVFEHFEFVVQRGTQLGNHQDGSPFHPFLSYVFNGCSFVNLDVLNQLYGGWEGASNTIKFTRCHTADENGNLVTEGKFICLGPATTTLTVDFTRLSSDTETLNGHSYERYEANAEAFFKRIRNYQSAQMRPVAYRMKGSQPVETFYYPQGLKTSLDLDFS